MKKSTLKKELAALRKTLAKRPPASTGSAPPSKDVPALRVVGGRSNKRISPDAAAKAQVKRRRGLDQPRVLTEFFKPYVPPPGVLPRDTKPFAMDSVPTATVSAWAQSQLGAYSSEGLIFMGYAELANLTVRPEYRVISQVISTECTRKWITFQATDEKKARDEEQVLKEGEHGPGAVEPEDVDEPEVAGDADPAVEMQEGLAALQQAKQEKDEAKQALAKQRAQQLAQEDGKADRINELKKEFDRLNVRDLFAKIVELDGFFGRVHLYIDTDKGDERDELMTDLGDGANEVTKAKFKKGDLKRLAVIEPIWTYPQSYNANDPLSPEWYNPSQWFVMGKQIHCSRLLTFVGRPVPDILKPAYAFGGLSLSQICKPYVDNWLQTRQSVNDIIHAFSIMVLQTDISSIMQGAQSAEGDLFTRLDIFNQLRDNRGVFAVDKETEDFKNVSAPLGSLDSLQAQAQEHMASVSRIPLVKLLGISPHGLNASSEGELQTFYDTINAYQEFFLRPNLTRVMHFAMMNLWGEVDEDITFRFEPLWALNEKEEAELRKVEAETYDILVNGVAAVHPEEVRKVVAADPDSPFQGIDVADVPDAPVEDTLSLSGHKPFGQGAQAEEDDGSGKLLPGAPQFGGDAAWKESDHPRVASGEHGGEFASGGGAGGASSKYGASSKSPNTSSVPVPPAKDHPLVRGPNIGLWGYSHGNSRNMTAYAAAVMDIPGYNGHELTDEAKSAVKIIMQAVRDSPGSSEPLYHGFENKADINWKVGDTLSLPLIAASGADEDDAAFWGMRSDKKDQIGEPTVFEFPVGTKMAGYARYDAKTAKELGYWWSEAIVGGKFEVTAIRTGLRLKSDHYRVIVLKPKAVFDPDNGKWRDV